MSNFIEAFRQAKEELDLSLMPFALEIKDPLKRQEFHTDYKRLVGRCGQAQMGAILNFYLIEQSLSDQKGIETFPKIRILGQKNTSEIIARFVENGLADFYLSKKHITPMMIAYNKEDKPLIVGSFHDGLNTFKSKEGGIPKVFAPEVGRLQRQIKNAVLIPPQEIRSVFAEIDAKYNTTLK
jgi:hypothetical protein